MSEWEPATEAEVAMRDALRANDQEHGLGIGGEAIHAWGLEEPRSPVDEAVLAHSFETTGAVVMGRRLYDIVDGPNGWNDDVGVTTAPDFMGKHSHL